MPRKACATWTFGHAVCTQVLLWTLFFPTTPSFFQHQTQCQVDIAVVEAGLGGARDATNVFPLPGGDAPPGTGLRVAVITAVGLEHQAALGGSLAEIAAAKAGIMKAGRPLVLGRQPEQAAADVLRAAAAALGCTARLLCFVCRAALQSSPPCLASWMLRRPSKGIMRTGGLVVLSASGVWRQRSRPSRPAAALSCQAPYLQRMATL